MLKNKSHSDGAASAARKFCNRSGFISFMIPLVLVIILAIICLTGAIFQYNRQMEKEINSQATQRVDLVQSQVATALIDTRNRLFLLSQDEKILQLTNYDNSADAIFGAYTLMKQISITETALYVPSFIGIYYADQDRLLTRASDMTMEQKWRQSYTDYFASAQEMEQTIKECSTGSFLPRVVASAEKGGLIVYGRSVRYQSHMCYVFSITQMSRLVQSYLNDMIDGGTYFVITDKSENIIWNNLTSDLNLNDYIMISLPSATFGWTWNAYMPREVLHGQLNTLYITVGVVAFALLLCGLIISVWLLRRAYQPLGKIVDTLIRHMNMPPSDGKHLDIVLKTLNGVVAHSHQQQKLLNEQLEIISEFSFQRRLMGISDDEPEHADEVPSSMLIALFPADKELKNKIAHEDGVVECTLMPDAIVALINGQQTAEMIMSAHQSDSIRYALGDKLTNYDNINEAYNEIVLMIQVSRYIPQRIIDSAQAHTYLREQASKLLPDSTLKLIITALLSGNRQSATNLLRQAISDANVQAPMHCAILVSMILTITALAGRQLNMEVEELNRLTQEAVHAKSTGEILDTWDRIADAICGHAAGEAQAAPHSNYHIRRIKQYIDGNFTDADLNISALAQQFNISAAYLSRTFKQETGEQPSGYLNNLRIEHAKALLINTDIAIKDIASQSGFTDSNTLIRNFRKITGITPAAFREAQINVPITENALQTGK